MSSSLTPDFTSEDRPTAARRPWAVRLGFALFAVGLVFLILTVIPFFFDDHNRSLWLNLGCMLAPLGFVVAVIGVIRAGRAEQRAAWQAVNAAGTPSRLG
ncbi:MAG: hypothetical protein JWO63_865 [Frankiales bacterium]|nr:hypothetical protein [Frankiales bacterium]